MLGAVAVKVPFVFYPWVRTDSFYSETADLDQLINAQKGRAKVFTSLLKFQYFLLELLSHALGKDS